MKVHAGEGERSVANDDELQACSLDEANPAVDAQLAGPATKAERPPASLERGVVESRRGVEFTQLIRQTLLPAYRRAVDAVDPMAAAELATHIVSAYRAIETARLDLAQDFPAGDPTRWMVSTPDSPADDTAEAATARWAELQINAGLLYADESEFGREVTSSLSPQTFRGADVIAGAAAPLAKKGGSSRLANEAGAVVELLSVVLRVRELAGSTGAECLAEIPDEQRQGIAAMVEPYQSRPIDFAFLVRVLREECLWELIESAKGTSGRALSETLDKTLAQADATGAFQDVGDWDADKIKALLSDASDDNAFQVFLELKYLPPSARGPVIHQIEGMGLLGGLCSHIGFQYVKALAEVIAPDDPSAAALLAPYYQDEGGGKSLHKIYEENAMENLEEGGLLNEINAFGWVYLDTAHNALTGGFLHEYSAAYDAHEQGWITDDEYYTASGKALGKAAVITAAAAISGGVVGPYAEGFAAGLGAGETAAAIIGGGVGGFASGISGHLTGDIYDQMLNGKEGFDSAGAYLESGAMGAGTGMALAGVSVLAGKYLPASQQRMGDIYAARYPRMMRVFEQLRRAGVKDGGDFAAGNAAAYRAVRTRVRMTARELQDLFDTFGGPPMATANGAPLDSLPPDTIVEATLVSDDLNRPMQMSSTEENGGGAGSTKPSPDLEGEPKITVEEITVEDPALKQPTVDETTPDQASTETTEPATTTQAPTTEEQIATPAPVVATAKRPATTPATVDDAVAAIESTGRMTGDMKVFAETVSKAKLGQAGALGELDAIQRWLAQGKTVEVMPETQNAVNPADGKPIKNPDYRVDEKIVEVKSNSGSKNDNWVKNRVQASNRQIRESLLEEQGAVELQLTGEEASALTLESAEYQLRDFNARTNKSVDRVSIYKDGELFAEWVRGPDGAVTRRYP